MRAAAAVAGGVAWALCFATEPRSFLAWVALVPLVWLAAGRHGGRWGLLHGFVAWLVSLSWLVETVVVFGGLPTVGAWPAVGLLALYLGAFQAAFAWLGRPLTRGRLVVALVGLPSLWVALEHLRGWLIGGFPWNLAAYAWLEVPGALPLAAWVGAWGVSWLVLFANVGLGLGLVRRRWDVALVGVLVPLAVLAAAGRWAVPAMPLAAGTRVSVVQPDVPIRDLDAETLEDNYQKVLRMAAAACPPIAPVGAADGATPLVILPESATWPYSYHTSARLRRDLAAIASRGCLLVINSAVDEGAGLRNVALVVGPDGLVGRYDKRELVPFGEYVPFARVLPFVGTLARNAGSFTPGEEPALLVWNDERLAMAICYEVTHGASIAEQVRAGATLLATITNDAWYGDTWAPWQHFRAVRFRAAESRRPMLRAALTGVSALVDARGAVDQVLGVGEEGTLVARVAGRGDLSPYSRAPWLVPAAATVTAVLLLASAIIRARRGRAG